MEAEMKKNNSTSNVAPAWVTQTRIYSSRLNALIEECNNLQDVCDEALCKNVQIPEHLIKRMDDLCRASMDAYGFYYKKK